MLSLPLSYAEEYGFPSTHAMFAAGIPLSLVLLSLQRYDVSDVRWKEITLMFIFHLVQYVARDQLCDDCLRLGVFKSHLFRNAHIFGKCPIRTSGG